MTLMSQAVCFGMVRNRYFTPYLTKEKASCIMQTWEKLPYPYMEMVKEIGCYWMEEIHSIENLVVQEEMRMSVSVSAFGKYPDGRDIELYTITNGKGMAVSVTNVGAALVKVMVPDKEGKLADVVLGFDRGEDYMGNDCFFGVVIGPNANRIAKASFDLEGVTYSPDVNDGINNLHSHKEKGWHKRLWNAQTSVGDNAVTFSLEDTDGNLGFPGNKKASVTYSLDEENALKLSYHCSSDRPTVLNLTNHSYFNLEGHDSGSMENHELWLNASRYTPADSGSIPTGEIVPVEGTPMDFTSPKRVGRDIGADYEQLIFGGGYDHNWVIDGWDGKLRRIAELKAPVSGRRMEVYTTLPGVQFYAGNFITEQTGKGGVHYAPRMGLCLETQYFPDSVNRQEFPGGIFDGLKEYDSVTIYKFGTV